MVTINMVSPPSNTPYIVAVVTILAIAFALIFGILLIRPNVDPTILISLVLTSLAPTIAAVFALIKAQETHLAVNSRLDEWITTANKNAKNEGIAEGTKTERRRVNEESGPLKLAPVTVTIKSNEENK